MHKNNYVYFNCDNLANQNSDTCEVWRIIGVFDVDDGTGNYEQRIKLVRGSALPDTKEWDTRTSEQFPNDNWGKNEWVGSTIQTYLNDNGDYYKRTGIAANYGLKANAKILISDAKYYLGEIYLEYNSKLGTADAIYLLERGTDTFNYNNFCSYQDDDHYKCATANYCENNPTDEICTATRNTSWVGEVGLMYPSDEYLVYANSVNAACYSDSTNCYGSSMDSVETHGTPSKGWIYNSNNLDGQNNLSKTHFLTANSTTSYFILYAGSDGRLSYCDARDSFAVRPVLYLSSNVKITDGTGEVGSPYKLGL